MANLNERNYFKMCCVILEASEEILYIKYKFNNNHSQKHLMKT